MSARRWIVIAGTLAAGACGPSAEEQAAAADEALRVARADSVAEAELAYDPANYDSISWAHPDSAFARGAVVWTTSCRKCHGSDGTGGGDLAVQYEIEMPDLTRPDWPYEDDREAIRHRIFIGHESEMPNWGLHGLRYRDIDAVSHYLVTRFR